MVEQKTTTVGLTTPIEDQKTTTAEQTRLKIPTIELMVGGARVELAVQQLTVEPGDLETQA